MEISYSPHEYLQKKENSCVGQGKSKTQNPTAHNSIAKVEDRHSQWSSSWDLEK